MKRPPYAQLTEQLLQAIDVASPAGLTTNELCAMWPAVGNKVISNRLWQLRTKGSIRQDGIGKPWCVPKPGTTAYSAPLVHTAVAPARPPAEVSREVTEATLRRETGPCSVFDVARAVSHSVGDDPAPEATAAPAPPPALQWKPAAAPQPAPQVNDPDDTFVCALFSDGRLLVESGGRQLDLPLDHTRALLHYLDHLRGTELVSTLGIAA